ncbi:MAG: exodeoxyribonuclease III [Proteobacteria bacterium]|nr:exodeoxyribonuclease III [Pseudomonadota bacterium]MBU4013412.1 exodeoxyribonuclease III [Pseudomonadota bacterium]MBU4067188.1 exodeoxyribonuclease III [Pseudomonadota bacterium]MBU4100656.1 exodeoxyribonuclease III [Pseudomonadota bacterium]MBU4126517.1 exodeoxyribonuclease III [Pseudomonadota bacterium]
MKMISWNVNGIRAVMNKDFMESFIRMDADIVAIQETKIQEPQLTDKMKNIEGYESYWSFSTVKKGYSGIGVYTRIKPQNVKYGMGISKYDNEGRIIEMDFKDFIFFNIYFPNGQMSEERLQYKLDFYRDFFEYIDAYKHKGKCLIIAGDYNTAHNEIDLKNPKANEKRSGFLRIERDWMDRIVNNGYVDTFRYLYPDTVKYSWWTYRFNARANNTGWRIDYFFVTQNIIDKGLIREAFIDNNIYGSDHCPVGIDVKI